MDGDRPPPAEEPPSAEGDASAILGVLAAAADVLTSEDDAVKGVARVLGQLVPERLDLCEVHLPGRSGPGPVVGSADTATRAVLAGAVAGTLGDGVARLCLGAGIVHALPLRSGSALLGVLGLVGDLEADAARLLAGLVALRLDTARVDGVPADSPLRPEDGAVHEARLSLRPRPQSAAVARSVVRDVLSGAGLSDVLDTAVLLVSELVSNALRHGSGPYELLVTCDADGVLVSVGDQSPTSPRPRRPLHDMLDEDGRGLLLVEALATDWGWTTDGGGKKVWFRLDHA